MTKTEAKILKQVMVFGSWTTGKRSEIKVIRALAKQLGSACISTVHKYHSGHLTVTARHTTKYNIVEHVDTMVAIGIFLDA